MKLGLQSSTLDARIVTRRDFIKYTAASAAALAMGLATFSEGHAEQTMPESHLINIPYYSQQTDNWCGEACTQMLLTYLNPQAVLPSQSELAKEFDPNNPSRGNTSPNAMVGGFQSRGYTEVYFQESLNIDRLKELISYEIPIVCRGGFDGLPTHQIIAVGYDDKNKLIIANDPKSRGGAQDRHYDYSLFDQSWTNGVLGIGQRNGVVVPYKGLTYIPPP